MKKEKVSFKIVRIKGKDYLLEKDVMEFLKSRGIGMEYFKTTFKKVAPSK